MNSLRRTGFLATLWLVMPLRAETAYDIRIHNRSSECQRIAVFQKAPDGVSVPRADMVDTLCQNAVRTIAPPGEWLVQAEVQTGKMPFSTSTLVISDPNSRITALENNNDPGFALVLMAGEKATPARMELLNFTRYPAIFTVSREGSANPTRVPLNPSATALLQPDDFWRVALVSKDVDQGKVIDESALASSIQVKEGQTVDIQSGPSNAPVISVEGRNL